MTDVASHFQLSSLKFYPYKRLQEINIHQLREKIGSKKELYDFLTQECGAYLPKVNCINVYFFRSIINGNKEYLKRSDVIVAAVPQIEGLTSDDFLGYVQTKPSILNYLPDQCDWLHLDKQWIVEILFSLDQEGINGMVMQAKIRIRQKLDQSNNLIVHMKPEFVSALNNSIRYSVSQTKIKAQLEQRDERCESVPRQSKQKYLENNERMRQEFQGMQEQIHDLTNYKQLVHQLQNDRLLDDLGCPQMLGPIQYNNNS